MVLQITVNKAPSATPQPAPPSQTNFVQRLIEVTITLDQNPPNSQPTTFANTNSNTITLSGSRTNVHIENSGTAVTTAEVMIYGLTPSLMNQLTMLGLNFNQMQRNGITVSAGTKAGLTPIFSGTIWRAFGDYNMAPNVPFHFECKTNLINQMIPVPASSFPNSIDVATVMAGFAKQLNYSFENNGVSVQLPSSYFPGTLLEQVQKLARDAHVAIDTSNGTLAIWPMGGSRTSRTVAVVEEGTGMDGYPSFSPNGYLIVKTVFNPQLARGAAIEVVSSLPAANKQWVIWKLDLDLESIVPEGNWLATAQCYPLGLLAPPPPQ